MKIIISPAKKMRMETDMMDTIEKPVFLKDTDRLRRCLRTYTREELKKLFGANDSITELNYQRYQEMDLERGLTPAVLSYVGLQYQSMAPDVFERGEWDYIREHVKILSGFYGLLNACDGVVPYRLEMQAKLEVDGKKDLYEFWGDRLYKKLAEKDSIILNLASKEYSKAVEPYIEDKVRFVTCVFGVLQGDKVKVKATAAKMARGDMVRWLAGNQIEDLEQVKEYRGPGYRFCPERSTDSQLVFLLKAE